MPRPRVALITGAVLLLDTPAVACAAGAVLRPGHPWHDVHAEQAAWTRTETLIAAASTMLLILAWILLAYGVTALRHHGRPPAQHQPANIAAAQHDN